MHVVILKLFHFYLFNFCYKSDTMVLRHSRIGLHLQDCRCKRLMQAIDIVSFWNMMNRIE